MPSAWALPEHIADVLPSEARHIEELRRTLLDTARSYGYELVMPPLLEYLDSLLTGTGEALDLQTCKLVDQPSGRTLGLRADTTAQVARIDAHLLNRQGLARLCYCGAVVHARPDRPHATREPLQFGAEIYGHQGLEADLEALLLALDCLRAAGVQGITIDLADVRIVRSLLAGVMADVPVLRGVHAALASKDASALAHLTRDFPPVSRAGLAALLHLYGDCDAVFTAAHEQLGHVAGINATLAQLRWLVQQLQSAGLPAGAQISLDLADLRGYTYYSGTRFALYAPGASDALVRGGRYDEVGAVFGRNRAAAGFSLDIKQLVAIVPARPLQAAIRAPWGDAARAAIAALRQQGHTVVCVLPGHESEVDEFHCDRELVQADDGQWVLRAL